MEPPMFEQTNHQFSSQQVQWPDFGVDEPTLIFTVIFSFIAFVIFLVMFSDKVFIETSSSLQLPVQELSMVIAKLPFQIEFLHLDKANLKDGVHIKVHVEEPVEVSSFWGVSCVLLINALNTDSTCLLSQHVDLEQVQTKHHEASPEEDSTFHITPNGTIEDLGPPPRIKYPLVIIVRCLNRRTPQENHIIGGVWIVHLSDSTYNQPSHVVSNLVITDHGHVHNLQKMYMAAETGQTTNENSESGVPSSSERNDSDDAFKSLMDGQHDCTVCQNNPISIVILPCRHGCVCEDCLKVVTKCPMCRGPMMSHFSLYPRIHADHDDPDSDNESDSWVDYIQSLCDRLNRRLGFT